jgi:CrcB protein
MTLAIAVALAGGIGAIARYLIDGAVGDRTSGVFPYGTTTVNVVGSFILGLVTGLVLYHGAATDVKTIAGTGFCGGLTTWSTFSWENVRLVEDGHIAPALSNALGGIAASVAAAALGLALAAL